MRQSWWIRHGAGAQNHQYYLPIDLRHYACIVIALFTCKHPKKGLTFVGGRYRADVSVAKDRAKDCGCLAANAEKSGKRQSRARKGRYQGRTGKLSQDDLPDTSDFLLRHCVPAALTGSHASSNLVAAGSPMLRDRNRGGVKVSAARLLSLCGVLGTIALLGATVAKAQDAEPRSYSNMPIVLNFLIAGALYSQGKLAFDPDLSVADANFHSETGVLA